MERRSRLLHRSETVLICLKTGTDSHRHFRRGPLCLAGYHAERPAEKDPAAELRGRILLAPISLLMLKMFNGIRPAQRYYEPQGQHVYKGKSKMRFCRIRVFTTLLAVGSSLHLIGQTNPSALPPDPIALMTLAHDKNGLVGLDVKPWHMRGTYRSFDTDGKLKDEGTYEEWWVSATKYKLSFTTPKYTQTDYANGSTLLRDGPQEWLAGPELLLRASVIEPLPDVSELADFTLEHHARAVGSVNLHAWILPIPCVPICMFQPTSFLLHVSDPIYQFCGSIQKGPGQALFETAS